MTQQSIRKLAANRNTEQMTAKWAAPRRANYYETYGSSPYQIIYSSSVIDFLVFTSDFTQLTKLRHIQNLALAAIARFDCRVKHYPKLQKHLATDV
jgi:hypothetical protein